MKAGDQVWHHATQRSVLVAVVDGDRFAVASEAEEWVLLADVAVQRASSREEERAMLLKWSRDSGARGAAARAEVGRQWVAGEWLKP